MVYLELNSLKNNNINNNYNLILFADLDMKLCPPTKCNESQERGFGPMEYK
jgi:hypothetical protein